MMIVTFMTNEFSEGDGAVQVFVCRLHLLLQGFTESINF